MRSSATRKMPEIVLDTCVTSNLAQAGGLESIPKAIRAGWLKECRLKKGRERALFESLSVSLGLREASSLAVAKGRGLIFARDDQTTRAEAARPGISLTGTLGILLRAVRKGACDVRVADGYLGGMIDAGFFSPVRSLREMPYRRSLRAMSFADQGQ